MEVEASGLIANGAWGQVDGTKRLHGQARVVSTRMLSKNQDLPARGHCEMYKQAQDNGSMFWADKWSALLSGDRRSYLRLHQRHWDGAGTTAVEKVGLR